MYLKKNKKNEPVKPPRRLGQVGSHCEVRHLSSSAARPTAAPTSSSSSNAVASASLLGTHEAEPGKASVERRKHIALQLPAVVGGVAKLAGGGVIIRVFPVMPVGRSSVSVVIGAYAVCGDVATHLQKEKDGHEAGAWGGFSRIRRAVTLVFARRSATLHPAQALQAVPQRLEHLPRAGDEVVREAREVDVFPPARPEGVAEVFVIFEKGPSPFTFGFF